MNWLITNAIGALLLPPLNLLLLLIFGMAMLRTRRRLGVAMLSLAIVTLWLAATPLVGRSLLRGLQQDAPIPPDISRTSAQAIVLLGAGRYLNAPEYGGDTIASLSLERSRYAAYLARKTGVPILASGGRPDGGTAESTLMQAVLEQEFHVPVRWVEGLSDNSADEARECWKILSSEGITRIFLVTNAWHMPRAKAVFKKAGFEVIPAPMGYITTSDFTILDLLPNSDALGHTRRALHEWIGMFWYGLRGVS